MNDELRAEYSRILLLGSLFAVFPALASTPETIHHSSFIIHNSAYTNHAGNVVSGVVVALDARTATISNATETVTLPLSIFPEAEQRRLAADFGRPRIPPAVKRAIAGAEKAMARSRKRSEKGLCSQEESDTFCAQSEAALRAYLDKQVESGVLTPAERKSLGR